MLTDALMCLPNFFCLFYLFINLFKQFYCSKNNNKNMKLEGYVTLSVCLSISYCLKSDQFVCEMSNLHFFIGKHCLQFLFLLFSCAVGI